MSLVVRGLQVVRSGRAIVDGADLEIGVGTLHGLIGPNGAGKSTLLRALLGLEPSDGGQVRFAGEDLLALPRQARARRAAFVEQAAMTEMPLTVADVVQLGRIPHQSVWQAEPSPADMAAVDSALAAVAMTPFRGRAFQTLSGGEQQKVLVARALAQAPALLVLDEPTNHLDIAAQLQMLDLLRARAREGLTVLVALHDLNLAAQYCDGLTVLHRGRTVAAGAPETVLTPALLREVYGVVADLVPHPRHGHRLIGFSLPDADGE